MLKPIFAFVILFLLASGLAGTGNYLSAIDRLEVCTPSSRRTISLRVQDKDGRFVADLHPEDLSLSENKAPRGTLKLERRTDEPLSVAILIDASLSEERTLEGTKLAAHKFVESILRSDKDRAAVASFTGIVTSEQDLTNNVTKLQAAIDRIKVIPPRGHIGTGVIVGRKPPDQAQLLSGSTAIWDAIFITADRMQPALGSRPVIVLLTDGEDTVSKLTLRDASERAATRDVVIFAIGIADTNYGYSGHDDLKKLTEETGGRAFFPKKVADLDHIFSETARALQSRYVLSYCGVNPDPAAKPLKLEIEIKNPVLRKSHLQLSYPHYVL